MSDTQFRQRFDQLSEMLHYKPKEFAAVLGISIAELEEYLEAPQSIPFVVIAKLTSFAKENGVELNLDWLFSGHGEIDSRPKQEHEDMDEEQDEEEEKERVLPIEIEEAYNRFLTEKKPTPEEIENIEKIKKFGHPMIFSMIINNDNVINEAMNEFLKIKSKEGINFFIHYVFKIQGAEEILVNISRSLMDEFGDTQSASNFALYNMNKVKKTLNKHISKVLSESHLFDYKTSITSAVNSLETYQVLSVLDHILANVPAIYNDLKQKEEESVLAPKLNVTIPKI